MKLVRVRGRGVAAYVAGSLLSQAGWTVISASSPERKHSLPLEIDEDTLALLSAIIPSFQPDCAPAAALIGRYVRWGTSELFSFLPGKSSVIDQHRLLQALASSCRDVFTDLPEGDRHAPKWTIDSAAPEHGELGSFDSWGSRQIVQAVAMLHRPLPRLTAWMTQAAAGWLYAMPLSPDEISLQYCAPAGCIMGRDILALLACAVEDSGVAELNDIVAYTCATIYPCAPRLARRVARPGRIAVAGAAARLDPICSQGVANSVRQAILAVATIEAIEAGGSSQDLLSAYRARLLQSFASHMHHCAMLYQAADLGDLWYIEQSRMSDAVLALSASLRQTAVGRYNLVMA